MSKKASFVLYFQRPSKKGRTNDVKEYNTKPAAGVQKIETLGGDYALKWDDETQMSVNAHAALLSQFAVRDLIATVMVSMVNGATRFRHCDRLHGDTATAELFGVGRFMSCDSVRRNFASIPDGKALPWVWRENLRLLQDVVAEDYVADLDPTVKPLYGHQEGAEFGYNPQKPGRPSHCYHTLCIAKLRLTLAVVVHPGNETSGTHSRSMLAEYLEFVSAVKKPRLVRGDVSFGNESVIGDCEGADVRYLFKTKRSKAVRRAFRGLLSDAGAWRDSSDGWQCAERDVRLDSWEKARRMVFARRPAEKMPKRKKAPPQRKFTQLDIPGLELVEAGDEDYADGYEWYALVTDLELRERLRRDEEPVGMERLHGAFAETDRALRGDGRDRGEPLERVHEARRRRDAPRGRHLPSAPPVVRREAVSPCAAGNRHHLHRHVRKGPWNLPRHQRFPVQYLSCVAVERRRTSPAHNRTRIPNTARFGGCFPPTSAAR